MRKLIVSEFDGVMQAPGGKDEDRDGGFEHGGWTWPFWHDDIGATFGSLMKGVDAFLLGRLLVYPLILGTGKRIFPNGVNTNFTMTSATPYPTGVVGLHYARGSAR